MNFNINMPSGSSEMNKLASEIEFYTTADIEAMMGLGTSNSIATEPIFVPLQPGRYILIGGELCRIVNEAPPNAKLPSQDAAIFRTALKR